MRRSLVRMVLGFAFAILVAALVGMLFKFPFATALDTFEPPLRKLLRSTWPLLPVALPLGLAAIFAGESQRWRHWYYWAGIGAAIGLCGFLALTAHDSALRQAFLSAKGAFGLMAMGLAGGHVYWWLAGHRAGLLSAALSAHRGLAEREERRRCWACAAFVLALGLIALAFLGGVFINKNQLPSAIITKTETDAAERLKFAGLKDVKFKITEHVGHITGVAPDAAAKAKMFDTANLALAPYVGIPGVVAILQNDIQAPTSVDPVIASVAESKRKADEEAAKKKAEELHLAAEAKRKAEADAAAKKKAEEVRLAAEAEAKRKADEEAVAKKKAEEIRLAAEAEAKRKADEEAVAKKEAEEIRLAAEAEAKRKADEEAVAKKKAEEIRLAAEAEAKKKSAEVVVAAKSPEPAVAPSKAPVTPAAPATVSRQAQCVSDFTFLFGSEKVHFGLNSAELGDDVSSYLDKIAVLAKSCGTFHITIDGHTDRTGNEIFNDELADDRAENVRAALVERGVASTRLTTHGYGAERPFDPTNNGAAFRLNRRVDLSFKDQGQNQN